MSAEPLTPPPVSPLRTPVRVVRVEYVDFQDVAEYREFRFRVRVLDGSTEVRARIAVAAFGPGRMRFQYDPPGGKVGAALAALLGEEPGHSVREDLGRLKLLLEKGAAGDPR